MYPDLRQPDWRCDTCTLTMPVIFQYSHLHGKRHLSRVRNNLFPKLVPWKWWMCKSCRVPLRRECQDAHVEGRLHQAGLEKQDKGYKGARFAVGQATEVVGDDSGVAESENTTKGSPSWMCAICNVSVPHSNRYDSQAAHKTGKSHLAKVRTGDVNSASQPTVPHEVSAKVVCTWRCITCDMTMNTGSMGSHLSGTAHKTRIRAGKPDSHQTENTIKRKEPTKVSNTAKTREAHAPTKLPLGDQSNSQCEKFRSVVKKQSPGAAALNSRRTQHKKPRTRGHSFHDPSRRARPSLPGQASQKIDRTGMSPQPTVGAKETTNKQKIDLDLDITWARDLKSYRKLRRFGWNTDTLPSADQKLRRGTMGWHGLVSSRQKGKKEKNGQAKGAEPAELRTWRYEEWARRNKRLS